MGRLSSGMRCPDLRLMKFVSFGKVHILRFLGPQLLLEGCMAFTVTDHEHCIDWLSRFQVFVPVS